MIVDKTGTLTGGKPKVVAVATVNGVVRDDVLRLAAALEKSSEHPLAAAIVRAAGEAGLAMPAVDSFDSRTGKGVHGIIEGRKVAIGNDKLLADLGIRADGLETVADGHRRDGATVVFVAIDGAVAGFVAVADPIKASASEAIRTLKADGLRIVMQT